MRVEQKVNEAFPVFQFECTEESPIPLVIDQLQFVPGDVTVVYVGGVQAVFGYITERHVAMGAGDHAVRLTGVGDSFDLTNSMVPLEKLGGHDGQSWTELARSLAEHLKIDIKTHGAVDNTPFQNIQVQPGETIMAVLERYAKMRNIVIGSNATGGLLAIGEHPALPVDALTEGDNILRANCAIRDQMVYRRYLALGQNTSGDGASGDSQNKQVATLPGTSTRNRQSVVIADVADTMHGVERRVQMEKVFCEGSLIEAQITVQGWFQDNNRSTRIWKAGEYYYVNSPSLILHEVLGCSSCVYEQTNQGTTTTLTMVRPAHMNGLLNYRDAAIAAQKVLRAEQDASRRLIERAKDYEFEGGP